MEGKKAWWWMAVIGAAVLIGGLCIQTARLREAQRAANEHGREITPPEPELAEEVPELAEAVAFDAPEWAEDVPMDSGEPEPEVIDTSAKDALAKMVWGEARGCSLKEQAACVWVVLNRVDDPRWPGSILGVLTQNGQFAGYDPANPVDPEIRDLVDDVIARWGMEAQCIGSVGRVIPDDYFYWQGDGKHNIFRREYRDTATWSWEMEDPYVEK